MYDYLALILSMVTGYYVGRNTRPTTLRILSSAFLAISGFIMKSEISQVQNGPGALIPQALTGLGMGLAAEGIIRPCVDGRRRNNERDQRHIEQQNATENEDTTIRNRM